MCQIIIILRKRQFDKTNFNLLYSTKMYFSYLICYQGATMTIFSVYILKAYVN